MVKNGSAGSPLEFLDQLVPLLKSKICAIFLIIGGGCCTHRYLIKGVERPAYERSHVRLAYHGGGHPVDGE